LLQGKADQIKTQISEIQSEITPSYQESSVDRPFSLIENIPGTMLPLLLKEQGPTLISFYKPGCPACSYLHPSLEQLAKEGLSLRHSSFPPVSMEGESTRPALRIIRMNTHTDIIGHKVSKTPTLLLVWKGKVKEVALDNVGEGLGDYRKVAVLVQSTIREVEKEHA
jgi:thiol-disulfide isomerase/thioredoxin